MAQQPNVFSDDLVWLYENLHDIEHAMHFNSYLTKWSIKTIRRELKKWNESGKPRPKDGLFGTATTLTVADYGISKHMLRSRPFGYKECKDEDAILMARECEKRLNGQFLCWVFEELIEYLRKAYSDALFQLRNGRFAGVRLPMRKWRPKDTKLVKNTPPYFLQYSRETDPRAITNQFRRGLSYFSTQKRQREFLTGVEAWFDLCEFCRHCLVHAQGRYTNEKFARLNKPQREIVQGMTRKTILSSEMAILPTQSEVSNVRYHMTGVALLIHRALSDSFDMDVSVLELGITSKSQ